MRWRESTGNLSDSKRLPRGRSRLRSPTALLQSVAGDSFSECNLAQEEGRSLIAPALPRGLQLALQVPGVVESFWLVQRGPKPALSGTLIMANGPALCSPLNGVGLVGSK